MRRPQKYTDVSKKMRPEKRNSNIVGGDATCFGGWVESPFYFGINRSTGHGAPCNARRIGKAMLQDLVVRQQR